MKKAAPINIDQGKRGDKALKAREGKFGPIIKAIPALAWSERPDGSTEFFNQHYLAYAGSPLEQLQDGGYGEERRIGESER